MGDYQVKALEEKVNKTKLIGDIVDNWLENGENRQTLVFCVNVKHSIAIKEAFERAGISAGHLDARSSDEERADAFDAMERGEITVLCNVALYQEGLDVPGVSCIIMARPTKSMGLWRQCGGRGLRIDEGKEDCLMFDHGNVLYENGLLSDEIEWTLDGKKKAWREKPKPREKEPVKCRVCNLVFEGANVCPDCGTPCKTFSKKIDTLDAELKEIDAKTVVYSMADKRRWYGMFREYWNAVGRAKGWKEGWIAAKYRDKFGKWPRGMDGVAPIEPSQEFRNWMTHQNIKWHKRKKKKKVDPNSSPLLNQWGVDHDSSRMVNQGAAGD